MISEEKYKKELIDKLNNVNSGWINGDKDLERNKKADIMNHSLKIAIEIKDDTNYSIPEPPLFVKIDFKKMNECFSDHIKSANFKFEEYHGYKTVFLLRSECIPEIVKYAIQGLDTYTEPSKQLEYIGRTGKYSEYIRRKISCFLLFINRDYYYFPNINLKDWDTMEQIEAEDILGTTIKNL